MSVEDIAGLDQAYAKARDEVAKLVDSIRSSVSEHGTEITATQTGIRLLAHFANQPLALATIAAVAVTELASHRQPGGAR